MFLTPVFKKLIEFVAAAVLITSAHADPIITGSIPFTFIPGTVISSSQVNANFQDIITKVNTNAAKNGANSSITSLLGLTTPIAPSVGGSPIYTSSTVGGTANAITVSSTQPAISSFTLTAGNFILIVPSATNTGATTLNVNSTGVTAITKTTFSGVIALTGGEIVTGNPTLLYYNGTDYVMTNHNQLYGTVASVASATTTDLALAGSHNISLTGTTAITSFGSNASTALPFYHIRAASTGVVITASASILTPGGGNIFLNASDVITAQYLGSGNWRVITQQPIVNTGTGSVNGLTIVNNSGTPTTQIDVTFEGANLCNTSNFCIMSPGSTFTMNGATTGAGGLDTGALANNTWYYLYIISNGSATNVLASTSATAPTMPSGYVYKYRVGAQRTAGAATFNRVRQKGNRAQYVVVSASVTPNLPIMSSSASVGSTTVPTWVAVSTSNYVPPTAIEIKGTAGTVTSGGAWEMIVAPNNAYGAVGSTTNPPPIRFDFSSNGDYPYVEFNFILETSDIYWANNGFTAGNGFLLARGWVDTVNAN